MGRNIITKSNDIIGIFDIETSTISNITREFLLKAQKSGGVVNVSEKMPKSFILCGDKNKSKVFISQISTSTLLKRSFFREHGNFQEG
jgi:hypothetical protein